MFKKFKPLHDYVLVKCIEEKEEKTAFGIIIPDAVAENTNHKGLVIAVGQGNIHQETILPLTVKIGDTVYFGKYSGTDAGDNHLIIRESDIFGIIEN